MTRQRLQPVIDAVVTPLLEAGFQKRQRSNAGFRFKKKRSLDDPIVAAIGPAYTWRMNEDVLGAFIAKTWYGTHLAPIYGVRHEGIMRLLEEASIDLDGHGGLFKPTMIEAIFKPTLTCYAYWWAVNQAGLTQMSCVSGCSYRRKTLLDTYRGYRPPSDVSCFLTCGVAKRWKGSLARC